MLGEGLERCWARGELATERHGRTQRVGLFVIDGDPPCLQGDSDPPLLLRNIIRSCSDGVDHRCSTFKTEKKIGWD